MEETFRLAVEQSRAANDWAPVLAWLEEKASYAHLTVETRGFPDVPDTLVMRLTGLLLEENDYRLHEGVLLFLESEWQRFAVSAREDLLPHLKTLATRNIGPQSRFLIAELLGEYYANGPALDALAEFAESRSDLVRAYATVGMGTMACHAVSASHRKRAMACLMRLSQDARKSVRDEAQGLLARVGR